MHVKFPIIPALAVILITGCVTHSTSSTPPQTWIDRATGHRIVRITSEPGSESFYFNINAFTPDGKTMAITTPTGIDAVDLATWHVAKVVEGDHLRIIQVGRKTGLVYYSQRTNIFAADLKTGAVRKLATLPRGAHVGSINCDETLIAGSISLDQKKIAGQEQSEAEIESNSDSARKSKARNIEDRFDNRSEVEMFFLNLATGDMKRCLRCNDWLNHFLFSPTDPNLLMFCHEGPWHRVDRIWTIRSDGSGLQLIHKRTMEMEIAGHEFWSADGKTIWYDLQTPRGQVFWVGGYELATGKRTWFNLQRNEWSVHFNVSPDGTLFCGDGGGPGMVAHAEDGKWIYLFHPELIENRAGPEIDDHGLIRPGVFHSERLVNMKNHDYSLEPNATFTPDMKWLIFRSNMSGTNQVYAVELKKADGK